jgi:two-component system, response regulator YesN
MGRVLVVDDEIRIRLSIVNRLEGCSGLTIVSGSESNGETALQWLNENYADICVTDVRMPRMGGIELIRCIKERFPWMACIVVSGYDDFGYVKQCLQLGAKDYILKPIDQNNLRQAIAKAEYDLNKSRYQEATELFVRHMNYPSQIMDKWFRRAQTLQKGSMPSLIVETLEMLESWVSGKYYLLPVLSRVWIDMLCENLKLAGFGDQNGHQAIPFLEQKTIETAKIRSFFRLCAVHTLEEGVKEIFDRMVLSKDNPSHKVVEQVKSYIKEHYAAKICLQELADNVNMSRTYLSNMFRKETGLTIWNYLVIVRMDKARDMLLNTSLRSYEIANKVGYENSIHFSQLFKMHYGLNPMEYKKRMNASNL